jgi:adenylate cyclase
LKRSSLTLIVLALFSVLGAFLTFLYPQQVLQSPAQTTFAFEYPSFATMDGVGDVFVIDRSLSRVRKIAPDGTFVFQIDGQKRTPGKLFYAVELAVDDRGYLYVLNQVMQENGFYTEREEILRYDPAGAFDRVVGSRVYAPEEIGNNNATRGRLTGLRFSGRRVSWFELGKAGIIESTVDTDTWRLEQKLQVPVAEAAIHVASVTRTDPRTLVYTTKQGFIVRQTEGQAAETLYSGDQATVPGSLSVPWWLGTDPQGNLLFSDLTRSRILRRSAEGALAVVLDNRPYREATGDSFPYIYYSFSATADGRVVTTNDVAVLGINAQGRLETIVSGGRFSPLILAVRAFLWLGLTSAALGLGLILFLVYKNLFRRRVSLIFKQLLVTLPLMTAILLTVAWTLIDSFTTRYEAQSFNHISQAIQVIAQKIDTDRLDRITQEADFMGPDYQFIRNQLHTALNHNQDPWNAKFYFALHRIRDGKIYTAMYLNDGVGLFQPYAYLNDPANLYWKAAQGKIAVAKINDAWGNWVLGVGPVMNEKGEVSALLEVGRDLYGFQRETDQLLWSLVPYVAAGFGVLILLFVLSTWLFLAPLRSLRTGVSRIAQGQWDTSLPIRGSDEVADLTVVFNRMTSYIRNYIDEIMALSQGYRRFVPQEFLHHLQKESVTQIQLGDQIQREMSVMFTDIRSFTTMSEKMTPKENFDFLNRYLSLVGPEVRKHEGFVDKYIGDAIMALFPRSPDDALQAAIEIIDLLEGFNRRQVAEGMAEIRIGLGIHTGLLMLGILGEQERMEGTVISDNVNLASRLEGLTKFFDASIIVSETTYAGVKNPDRYHFRSLGKVKVKGKKEPVGIYEVLDGLPQEIKVKKARAQQNLEAGIGHYQSQAFEAARHEFLAALELSPDDTTVKVYLTLCRHAMTNPPTGEWTGAITMNSK